MSGHVAFGEGRNDAYFMQKAFERCNVQPEIKKFLAEEQEEQTISLGEQEIAMRDFRRTDTRYFVKSEGSDSSLYDIFAYSTEKIIDEKFTVTLVVDLDPAPFSKTVAEIGDSLDELAGGPMEWTGRECHEQVDDLWLGKATVADPSLEVEGSFYLLAFENDLEAAVGCSSNDPRTERKRCIREYVRRSDVARALVSLYG